MIKGVILDVDGTLVNSNDSHAEAFQEAFKEHGYSVYFQDIRRLIGMGGKKLVAKLAKLDEDSPQVDAIAKRQSELFLQKYLPRLKAFPHSRDLVLKMRRENFKVVVGSSAAKEQLLGLLKVASVDDIIDDYVSASDVKEAKPEPRRDEDS